ncbi:LysR substrate-binding domain-containing protein [Acidihalobacter prosperus]|uniref:HTH lysR-type domain-containing protein n=1 Tax=Acidihalobacter prosperus TaxID=160660 RepID=A0A1A6C0C6_9GAMM|nr:LysR substrate-binding domain-containing protein [Acidihalobacter prosperus]OBS08013.1 hypothetical protein Thpro_022263 [Acidihalobacter prosperus]
MRINPEQLITFAHVVREGGIGAAARARHLTQPAVSNQLRQLQSIIGEPLYRRQGRGIALTSTGQQLYRHAQALADALQEAESFAASLASVDSGRVRIAASQTLGAYILPAALAEFREHAPRIEIILESHNSQSVLDHLEACDIGLIEGPVGHGASTAHFTAQPLGSDTIVAVVPSGHRLASRRTLALGDVADEPIILREAGSGTRELVEAAFEQAGITPRVSMTLAGVAAVIEAARQGLGIGFLSALALRHEGGHVVGIPLRPGLRRRLTLLTANRPSRAAERFIDFLKDFLARTPAAPTMQQPGADAGPSDGFEPASHDPS